MILNKKLDDPLSELSLPNFARLGINHHSSTSLNYPDGIFVFRYIICTQEDRRKFDGNANMAAGVAVGDALSYIFAKTIWKMNPLTKKLAPVKNEFLSRLTDIVENGVHLMYFPFSISREWCESLNLVSVFI